MKVKKMDKENIHGEMVVIIMEHGNKIKLTEMELIYGVMEENILANG